MLPVFVPFDAVVRKLKADKYLASGFRISAGALLEA
jgi:hypothetical protein